jgi:hypothetical protein
MAKTMSSHVRVGASTLKLDTVGGTFASPTDLGNTSEDGITINYECAEKEIGCAQDTTIQEILKVGPERLEVSCMLKEHTMQNMALAFGQIMTDVTDNTGDTPLNESIFVGGWKPSQYYAVQIKVPQPDSLTVTPLYDVFTFYKVKFVADFSQVHKVQEERYIPVKFICVADAHIDHYAEIEQEYTNA